MMTYKTKAADANPVDQRLYVILHVMNDHKPVKMCHSNHVRIMLCLKLLLLNK